MSQYGYVYNVIMCEDAAGALGVMDENNLLGYEAFSVFYDKNGVMNVAVKRPMTQQEWSDAQMKYAINNERRRKYARHK